MKILWSHRKYFTITTPSKFYLFAYPYMREEDFYDMNGSSFTNLPSWTQSTRYQLKQNVIQNMVKIMHKNFFLQ